MSDFDIVDENKLSASEAVFGFCGWLTTRSEITEMGNTKDCAVIADLIALFCKTNNLDEPRDTWTDNLSHPEGEKNE